VIIDVGQKLETMPARQAFLNLFSILPDEFQGELHSLGSMIIESLLISKGYSVFNIAPSVPSPSVISFLKKLEPDLIIISISLAENLSSAKRLIKDILESKGNISSILVGGAGVSSIKKEQNNSNLSGVKFFRNTSLSDLLISIKEYYTRNNADHKSKIGVHYTLIKK
jgi:cobalamin-dependent methionine synthase I